MIDKLAALVESLTDKDRITVARIISMYGHTLTEQCGFGVHDACDGVVVIAGGTVTSYCTCDCHLTPEETLVVLRHISVANIVKEEL